MTFDLRHGDCLAADGLASLDTDSIDHVITDPPYSAHVHAKSRAGSRAKAALRVDGRRRAADISRSRDLGFEHITTEQMEACADQFARICKRWVLIFCDVESSQLWAGALRSAELEYVRTLAWVKLGAAPQFTGDRPASGFEAIVCAHRPGKKRWNGGGRQGVYQCPIALNRGDGTKRAHTTQKPEMLMDALVRDFTERGDLVLDPFAGSGTTGAAAVKAGRRFIGWELEEKYHAGAVARLGGMHEQLALPVATRTPRAKQMPLGGG